MARSRLRVSCLLKAFGDGFTRMGIDAGWYVHLRCMYWPLTSFYLFGQYPTSSQSFHSHQVPALPFPIPQCHPPPLAVSKHIPNPQPRLSIPASPSVLPRPSAASALISAHRNILNIPKPSPPFHPPCNAPVLYSQSLSSTIPSARICRHSSTCGQPCTTAPGTMCDIFTAVGAARRGISA